MNVLASRPHRWATAGFGWLLVSLLAIVAQRSIAFDEFASKASKTWVAGLGWLSAIAMGLGLVCVAAHLLARVWTARKTSEPLPFRWRPMAVAGVWLLMSFVATLMTVASVSEFSNSPESPARRTWLGSLATIERISLFVGLLYVAAALIDAAWRNHRTHLA